VAKVKHGGTASVREKEFLKLFDQLTYSRSGWQVWEDLMTVMACSICNAVDRRKESFERREKQFEKAIKALGGVDLPAQMLGIITMALEENPNQDFLGKLYMNLNLGSHWHGQFFTPYHICELMAKMQIGDGCQAEVESKGYLSVCDMCIGAGAMLIAAAAAFRERNVNYQTSVLFVGQDIDSVVAKMAYIQLSLIGCSGFITVGDSLRYPQTGHVLFPEEKVGQELWIMPMFQSDVWQWRKIRHSLGSIGGTVTTEKTVEKERFYMFFDFEEKEAQYGNQRI
jgi:type I restriction-modification system DNA methylase subunit